MPKVITVSRHFMQGHPKAGQTTDFIEKIWCSLMDCGIINHEYLTAIERQLGHFAHEHFCYLNEESKHHTIRGGNRWKTGDKASLRVWSDIPYRSPQIVIAPDVTLTVKDVEINQHGMISVDGSILHYPLNMKLAGNDGLTFPDFNDWFAKAIPFSGQVLIWNNNNLPY